MKKKSKKKPKKKPRIKYDRIQCAYCNGKGYVEQGKFF